MKGDNPLNDTYDPVISLDYQDLETPGVQVELDPDEAESLGAFHETALSEADAWEANMDVQEVQHDHL
jgi:type IV secretion system protein VirB1